MDFGTVQDTHKKTKMEKVCGGFWDVSSGAMELWIEKYGIMGFWSKAPPKYIYIYMFTSPKRKTKELN
jgi:hypothetical protein